MYMLAAFRAFQGIGAGGLFSLALAIIGDFIAPRERARYQGYFMAVFATSSVLGPVIGGFFAGQQSILGITGWRWIFYINVPIGLIALVVVNRTLHVHHERRDHRIDWFGAAALIVGLVPLLIIAEQGRLWGWASPVAFACYLLGVAGVVGVLRLVESRMGDDALIPLRLFRRSVFSVGSGAVVHHRCGHVRRPGVDPALLADRQGGIADRGWVAHPAHGGRHHGGLDTFWPAHLAHRAVQDLSHHRRALLVIGMLLLSTISADTPLWQTDLYMVVFGAGLGLNMQTIVLAMQNAGQLRDMGVATSSVTFFRQVGGTLGTAVFLSILFSEAPIKIAGRFREAGFRSALRCGRPQRHGEHQYAAAGSERADPGWVLRRDERRLPSRCLRTRCRVRAVSHDERGSAATDVRHRASSRGRGGRSRGGRGGGWAGGNCAGRGGGRVQWPVCRRGKQ